jgi:ABC-type sugar transport system substrate-binding protein
MPAPLVCVNLLNSHQEFQLAQAEAARDAGARLGASVEIQFAENSPIVQIQQLLACVNRPREARPLAVVVELAGSPAGYMTAARAALSAGVAWVEVSGDAQTVAPLRAEFSDRLVMSVITDEEGIGRIHAEQCRALLPRGGTVLYVEGPGLQVEVKARRRALEAGLKDSSITIEKTLAGNWTEESAFRAMAACLERPSGQRLSPGIVCAQNDAMALGAHRAAAAARPSLCQIPYLGCDALPDGGQRLVASGILAASVVKPVTAGVAVEDLLRGVRESKPLRDVLIAPESFPPIARLREFAARGGDAGKPG